MKQFNISSLELGTALYRGLGYRGKDENPVQLSNLVPAGVRPYSTRSTDEALSKLFSSAARRNVTLLGLNQLREFMHTHGDFYRARLDPDPLAKV